ncbi:MAG: thiamine-binding protein [Raineya sp.]
MQITAELSLYPLHSQYEQSVWDFIEDLRANPALEVQTNGMSTQVFGEIDAVMPCVTAAIKKVYATQKAILVMKIGKGTLKL